MEPEEKQESTSPLPVLPRLDRLDRLLQLLEEKHNFSVKHSSKPAIREMESDREDQHCRTLSNALDEVHNKGTLMERLEMLENRVLQLGLDVDECNSTSKSSTSSTVPVSEKFGNRSGLSSVTKEDQDVTSSAALEGKGDPLLIQEETSAQVSVPDPENRKNSRKQKTKSGRKWRCWNRSDELT